MALLDFQRAFAALVASPALCVRARADADAALAEFALTARERARLSAMVADHGMSANCTLYRVNRLIPVYSVLPISCRMLGTALGPELDGFAAASRHATLQYRWEAWRFGLWLRDGIADGRLPDGPLADAIDYELALFDARTAAPGSAGRRRTVSLRHDPVAVLAGDAAAAALPRPVLLIIDAASDPPLRELRAA